MLRKLDTYYLFCPSGIATTATALLNTTANNISQTE
jgi:hypothetical protein